MTRFPLVPTTSYGFSGNRAPEIMSFATFAVTVQMVIFI
jgi:hypothetical protein